MHPFDIRTILLAKHAQHVVLIHFPIALFIMGALFDFGAQFTKKQTMASAAYWNLIAAALSTVPVLITGVIAWKLTLGGPRLKGILLLHLVMACAASTLMWVVAWLHFRAARKPDSQLPGYRLPIELLTMMLVAVTGHLGGFLSGVNG